MPASHDADDSLVGSVLDGRYRIDRILGVGGMGAVYRGVHELLGTPIAVKVMRSTQDRSAERFLAEARRTFRLDHPNCVRLTDAGVAPGELLYLVMELLEGRTLGEELDNDGRIGADRVSHIGAQIASAIGCAHDLGYVHRDIKPDNIMLLHKGGDADFVKVLDFGLAKLTDEAKLAGKHSVMSFTRNGMVFGTPLYMSPEQAQGHRLDARSDLYSLGVVLYEALAGQTPFDAQSDVEILIAHVQKAPPPLRGLSNPPPALEALILKLLAKRPEDRYENAEEVVVALKGVASEAPRRSGPRASVAASETLALGANVSAELEAVAVSRQAAPTRVVTPPSAATLIDDFDMPRSRRGPIVAFSISVLAAAAALTAFALLRGGGADPRAPDAAAIALDPVDGAAVAAAFTDAGAADANSPPDAAPDAADETAEPTRPSEKERKAQRLFDEAMAAKRAGGSTLAVLPKLQAAYRADSRNREIRRAYVAELLNSKDENQRKVGCKMIRSDRARYEREKCAQASGD